MVVLHIASFMRYNGPVIALLRGIVVKSNTGYVVLDVNGVGYKVHVPVTVLESLPEDGSPVTLEIQTQVREDDISLYGFSNETDRRVFELLQTVTGVGPKAALGLLSAMSAGQLAQAVATEDVRAITRVPGIGPKTAQRMVLELKEKLAALGFERTVDKLTTTTNAAKAKRDEKAELLDDVTSALMNLGYNKAEATRATDAAFAEKSGGETGTPLPKFADLLRAALNRLTKA